MRKMEALMRSCDIHGIVNHEDVIRNGHQKNGEQEKTVERWIRRIAPHCSELIKQELRKRNHRFTSVYLQMDELWSYLWRKKTKVWIWTGIDVATRLVIFQLFYNFVRPHMSLTIGKGRGKQKRTPAIAAGLTDHIWNCDVHSILMDLCSRFITN